MNESYKITSKVNEAREFLEIADDFSNPLDLVREAISNSYDANAKEIHIGFDVIKDCGEDILIITIEDNGCGMDREGLQAFFDLGNSLSRGDSKKIGEKGHGTKVYFNSRKIKVLTTKENVLTEAILNEPYRGLYSGQMPIVDAQKNSADGKKAGTRVEITGYNNNRRDKFTHEIVKDYILWFTKHGTVEKIFRKENKENYDDPVLYLKGLGKNEFEKIEYGHYFPDDSVSVEKLFNEHLINAPDFYCKKIVKTGQLRNFPEIKYQAVFGIEGMQVKHKYNPMISRPGHKPSGGYTIQERYGFWLCKDGIPIQKKNEWITYKGSEYTKFHAFFNCQSLKLTANRGSVDNTQSEILQDIESEVRKIYDEIIGSDDWLNIDWLEEEVIVRKTIEKEKKSFDFRRKKVNKANVAKYRNYTLVEPQKESGVFSLFLQLSIVEPDLFPFQIIDYDTHEGIDVIAKGDKTTPLASARLYYVEFKKTLAVEMNHSFENMHSIVCWDTEIKHDDIITDINKEERKMYINSSDGAGEYTKYFLDNPKKAHKIEVFVLKDYLKEKLGVEFRPRTDDAIC